MSVQFNEDNEFHIKSRALFGEKQTPTMIRILLKSGIVKNEKQAVVVLLFAVVVMASATWFVLNGRGEGNDYVVAPDGTRYSAEEYIRLVRSGIDPLRLND
jgi:hypothetical protein